MTGLRQTHYRYRTDSGAADSTPTWGAGEDANFNPGSNNFRLRLGLRNAAGIATGSVSWELYVSKNGGSYSAVTTSSTSGLRSVDAGSSADDAALLIPRLYPFSPDWQLSGSAIDLDFAGNRIFPNGAVFTDYLSCSRASIGYGKNADGTLTQFASDALRRTDLGLLIEDARTNSLLQSVDLTNVSAWIYLTEAITLAAISDLAGGTEEFSIIEKSGTEQEYKIQQSISVSSGTERQFTVSIYAKQYSGSRGIRLFATNAGDSAGYILTVNLADGSLIDFTPVGTEFSSGSYKIEPYAGGRYRLSITFTCSTATSGIRLYTKLTNPANSMVTSYVGDGTSGIGLYGPMIEENAGFGSSYIPTTTTSATRAADVITNASTLQTDIAAGTGSIVVQVDNGILSDAAANIIDSNGTNLLGFDATNHGLASILATLASSNTANRTSQDKLGIAWDASGRTLVLNGGTVATDATAQTPSSTQHLGSSGTANFAYAYVERITVWTSKLADATLQGFTS